MALGDGAIVRAGLSALVDFLHKFAAPTGARASVLLMAGGLVILGFLFVALLFRSAIVGDLAPVANERAPTPRVNLPPVTLGVAAAPARRPAGEGFAGGRNAGREADIVKGGLDAAFDHLRAQGADARIILSGVDHKRVRVYRCLSCDASASRGHGESCEFERGLLVGAFEALTGELAKAEEIRCRHQGAPHCEFEVRHAPLPIRKGAVA